MLPLGVLEGLGGALYSKRVGHEIDEYSAALAQHPAAFRAQELAHMQGTTSRFVYYRLSEVLITVGGLGVATYGFTMNHPTAQGIGAGMLIGGLPLLLVDTYNNDRAHGYSQQLRDFDPQLAISPRDGGMQLALSAKF
jgi:hypothetical protein